MATTIDLPRLGGRLKDIEREATGRMKGIKVPRLTKPVSRLSTLAKAEKAISRAGKSQISRVLGSRLGARLLPALAIALAAKDVYDITKEGVNAYVAKQDLERTREHIKEKYGTIQRANATRRARTQRR